MRQIKVLGKDKDSRSKKETEQGLHTSESSTIHLADIAMMLPQKGGSFTEARQIFASSSPKRTKRNPHTPPFLHKIKILTLSTACSIVI
jgi:hypothetical protein